jgi:hypothetical protein
VDGENAFDKFKRHILFDVLEDKSVPKILSENILKIYTKTKQIRADGNTTQTKDRLIKR